MVGENQQASPPPLSEPIASSSLPDKQSPVKQARPWLRSRRAVVIALLSIPLAIGLGYWLIGLIALGDTAKLTQLKGIVQCQKRSDPQWQPAMLNQLLKRQERLRTGAKSSAQLLFFDASTVELDENTEISIEQLAKRRQGNATDIVLKTWVGKTVIRAVRFIDPSSSLRVETESASTVVRGARFTVQVAPDGSTQIDVEEGQAEVTVGSSTVPLDMGQRITLKADGSFETDRLFEPNAQLVLDRVTGAWEAPGSAFQVELTQNEINQFFAAMAQEESFFLSSTQVWLLDGEARLSTVLKKPQVNLVVAFSIQAVKGKLKPHINSLSIGKGLTVPRILANTAMDVVLKQLEEYLTQAYDFVEFKQVKIQDGKLEVTGNKRE